jgi:hypothetical protein
MKVRIVLFFVYIFFRADSLMPYLFLFILPSVKSVASILRLIKFSCICRCVIIDNP